MEESKKTYEKVLSERGKTGNASVSWRFFEDLHNIFSTDPKYTPVVTASSSGNCREADKKAILPLTNKNFSPGGKKRLRLISAFEIDEKRQRRHDEK